jgi:hypothetical protein
MTNATLPVPSSFITNAVAEFVAKPISESGDVGAIAKAVQEAFWCD